MAVEKITIVTEMIDKASGQLRKVAEVTQNLNRLQGVQVQTTERLNTKTNQMDLITKKTTRGLKSFNFAWLSVMFAGMALSRVFGGLIKSQLKLFGIMDLFSSTLTLVMLPVMILLLPLFFKLAEFFSGLPDGVKLAIGVFVILAAIFGFILLIVGQVALAVGGFALLFPALGAVASGALGAIVGALGTIAIVIAIVVALALAMFIAWKEDFLGMKEIVAVFVKAVKSVFMGLFNVLKGLIKFFTALFKGDFEGVKEAVILIFKGLVQIITGLIMALVTAIAAIIVGIARAMWGIIQTVIGFWKWLFRKLVGGSIVPDMVNAIIFWFWKLPGAIMDALKSILKNVFDWGMDFIKNMGDGIKSMASKFKDALLSIFPSWARSSIWAGGSMVIKIFKNITETVKKVFSGGRTKKVKDFILRPGGDLIQTDPRDTIVGFKGKGPNLGGGGGEITINNFNTFNVSDKAEMEKMLDVNNAKLTEEVKRLIGI